MHEPRNIVLYVILSIVTCGLWSLVWFFQLGGDIQALRGDDKPNTLVDFLLTIVTCGLWGFYVAYQWPTLLQDPMRAGESTSTTTCRSSPLCFASLASGS